MKMLRVLRRACVLVACGVQTAAGAEAPFWRVATLSGDAFGCLNGTEERRVAVLACGDVCAPIPWQLDERDERGDLALDGGNAPTRDDPPGVIDPNDELLWMVADAGRRIRPGELPSDVRCAIELSLRGSDWQAWSYAVVLPDDAPRSARRYVTYDPNTDTVAGARVALGFGAPTPRLMALRHDDGRFGPNLLDRLKVRASARFFGIIPLGRDEDDIQWAFGGWRAGPIRVVRREWQWVQLGWGLRTPVFRTETLVSRDGIVLPVKLRLNFPPTYFFAGLEVQAALDFRDLRGWRLRAAGAAVQPIGTPNGANAATLDGREASWLALEGPSVTLILQLQLADSLASLRTRLLAREGMDGAPPEAVPGELPAVGFRLTDWSEVDRGHHAFAAVSTALPAGYDVERFLAAERDEIRLEASPLAPVR